VTGPQQALGHVGPHFTQSDHGDIHHLTPSGLTHVTASRERAERSTRKGYNNEESLEYPVADELHRGFSLLACPELIEGLKMTWLRKSCPLISIQLSAPVSTGAASLGFGVIR
jgi:hypothetical protein